MFTNAPSDDPWFLKYNNKPTNQIQYVKQIMKPDSVKFVLKKEKGMMMICYKYI